MEEVFNVIGKLYLDVYNSQKVIELLQQQLKDKDQQLAALKLSKDSDE